MTEKRVQTANPSTDLREEIRRKNAVRINLVTGLLLLVVSIPSLITIPPAPTQQYIGNIITTVMGLISLISAWISYRYSSTRGSILFISAILLVSLGIPIYANGLGLQAGIITAIMVTGVAATTLRSSLAARASLIAFIVESLVILMDLYLPDLGLGELESPSVNIFLILVLIVFTFYVFRQYGSYTLRAKLTIFFVLVAIIAVSAVAVGINTLTRNELSQQVGLNIQRLAEHVAEDVSDTLVSHIHVLQSSSTQFEEVAADSNASYPGTEAEITANIKELDQAWRTATDSDPLIQNVLKNHAGDKLRELQAILPDHVEVFLTDRYGATIAATNRTSDYYQADEDWWRAAYNAGQGATYVGQPEFDESSQTYAVNLAIPVITSEQEVVGVLQSTLNITVIVKSLEEANFGETGKVDLRLGRGALLGAEPLTTDEITTLDAIPAAYRELPYQGALSLVSQKPILASEADDREAISQLGWSVVVHQQLDEALQPVENQSRTTILIALAVLLVTAIFGLFASQRIAAPIVNLTNTASQIAAGNLASRALINTPDEIGALASAFNLMTDQLNQTLGGLEHRVAERTADLELAQRQIEKRAQELQTISEISRLISSEQRLEILLPFVTRLVSEKFDFYHVGIFFVDDTRQFAILQAANSVGGQRMLNRGHRVEVGHTTITGNAAETGKARIALDLGTDAVSFDNSDLPGIRSQMALPLNVRSETIGVLDVQSTKPNAFTENDANLLGILADQIAIAIENARLFGQTQQAFSEVQSLYTQFLQQEWQAFGQQASKIGYHKLIVGGKPLEAPIESDEIRKALDNGEVSILDGRDDKSQPSIAVPVKLRGLTIGVLNIKSPTKYRRWSQDEINLAQVISDRLALALDNARLLQESQRRAAKEAKIGEVTAKIGASINIRNVLQTAVEELGRALPGSEVVIQFEQDESKKG
jgi:GAF domain-containing protein/HAMP domain-containing protein